MHDVGFILHSYNVDTSWTPIGRSIWQEVMRELKRKYKSVSEAEDALRITAECYLKELPGHPAPAERQPLSASPALLGKMKSLTGNQISDLVVEGSYLLDMAEEEIPLCLQLQTFCLTCLNRRSLLM